MYHCIFTRPALCHHHRQLPFECRSAYLWELHNVTTTTTSTSSYSNRWPRRVVLHLMSSMVWPSSPRISASSNILSNNTNLRCQRTCWWGPSSSGRSSCYDGSDCTTKHLCTLMHTVWDISHYSAGRFSGLSCWTSFQGVCLSVNRLVHRQRKSTALFRKLHAIQKLTVVFQNMM